MDNSSLARDGLVVEPSETLSLESACTDGSRKAAARSRICVQSVLRGVFQAALEHQELREDERRALMAAAERVGRR